MKSVLTILITFVICEILKSIGATFGTWQFWALYALTVALACVQYIQR